MVYYRWVVNHCPHCERGDGYRIGILTADGKFFFDYYPTGIGAVVRVPILSWSDWKKVVVRAPEDSNDPLYRVPWGHIEREDGEVIPPDEFEAMIEGLAEVQ